MKVKVIAAAGPQIVQAKYTPDSYGKLVQLLELGEVVAVVVQLGEVVAVVVQEEEIEKLVPALLLLP
jgi:hypothetical protein